MQKGEYKNSRRVSYIKQYKIDSPLLKSKIFLFFNKYQS